MVKVSYEQKPYRRLMMNTWGAECIASPSTITASGRAALNAAPTARSLGLAISEAVEMALQHPEDTRYCLGSVLNHVILHPDRHRAGGGRTDGDGRRRAGRGDRLLRRRQQQFCRTGLPVPAQELCRRQEYPHRGRRAVELPEITRGTFQYDFGDGRVHAAAADVYANTTSSRRTSMRAACAAIRGGFDRAVGVVKDGLVEARSCRRPRPRGRHPSPRPRESSRRPSTHAIAAAIREALQAKEEGRRGRSCSTSGNGVIDLYAYEQYLAGALRDYVPGDDEIAKDGQPVGKII